MKFSIITAAFLFAALLSVLPAFLFGILAAGESPRQGERMSRERKRQFAMIAVGGFFVILAAVTLVTTRATS